MHDLTALLGPTRTVSTTALSHRVDPRTIRRWLSTGRLVRLHPGWVTAPEHADDWTVRAHAAVGYTGGLLSHTSALTVHGILERELTRLELTVPSGHRIRSAPWVRIHRSGRTTAVVIARGLGATDPARSLVDTWDLGHRAGAERGIADIARNAVLRASRERRVTVHALETELSNRPRIAARRELVELIEHVRAGAQSHLEVLGLRALLATAGLSRPVQQYRVVLPSGPVYLDAAWPEVKLAVEFDGAAFHTDPVARRRDLRRDAALAALGWLVLRFTFEDVAARPRYCAAQVLAVYRRRLEDVPQAGNPTPRMPASGSPSGA